MTIRLEQFTPLVRHAMTRQPSPVLRSRPGSLCILAALALFLASPAVASGARFPTAEQLRTLETAAAHTHAMPPELQAQLTGNLAEFLAARADAPLRMLWLPEGFQLDGNAFCQAFAEDWNRNDDIGERSRKAEDDFAPWLGKLVAIQLGYEKTLAEAHARMPGVLVQDNGIQVETQAAAYPEQNVPILKANSLEVRDLRGNLFYAAPFGDGSLIDMAELPEPVAELVDRLPRARAWVFLLPTALLTSGPLPSESPSRLVLILQNATENTKATAWQNFAQRLAPAFASLPRDTCSAPLRTALSAYVGHMVALNSKQALRALPEETRIDARQLGNTLLERLNRQAGQPLRPEEDGKTKETANAALQACRLLLEARQTEVERGLLQLHAGEPGVCVAPSGLQYSVEQSAEPGENKPFAQANHVCISRIGGKMLVEQRMRPEELPCIADIAASLPAGKTWTFYVPGNLTGEYRLLDTMEAGVVLTFSVDDGEQGAEELPRPEMPDTDTDADADADADAGPDANADAGQAPLPPSAAAE